MAYTLQNPEYLADIELVASEMGIHDLMSLLHTTHCHDDPATDSYNLWQYLQCTYRDSTEHVPQPEVTGAYDAVMQQRAIVLHWVGYLKHKIHNHTLAKRYPLQATYGLQEEDVVGFMNMIHLLREMANHLKTRNSSMLVSDSCSPIQDTQSKTQSAIRRSARLAKKRQTRTLDTADVVRGC